MGRTAEACRATGTDSAVPSGASSLAEEAGPLEKVLADIADVGWLVPAVVMADDESKAVAWARDVGQDMTHRSPAPQRHRA